MNKKAICLLLALFLSLTCAAALAATANATVVAPATVKLTAPFSGILKPFDLTSGERVSAEDVLFEMDTTPVYAPLNGTLAAVFANVGDDAAGVTGYYGALAVIEPAYPLYIDASTADARDRDENKYIHVGETLYLRRGSERGTGRVTSVSGERYVVQVLTGNFELDDDVRCYRDSGYAGDSETGRGPVKRFADALVTASGRIAAVHAAQGEQVSAGELLFETVDTQCEPGAPLQIAAPVDGAVTALAVVSGAQVYRGQLLCEIADLTNLELSAEVDEIDIGGIRVGDTLSYTLDAYEGDTLQGTVTEIRPIGIEKQNATYFDVRVTVPADRLLMPGMNGTVTLN